MFWGRNYEQWEQQCFSPILVNDLKSNVILCNILHCIDYATITMFTMSRRKHCVYSFCTMISAFFSPTKRTKNFLKSQTQKSTPFIQIQPRLRSLLAKSQILLKLSYNRDYVLFMYILWWVDNFRQTITSERIYSFTLWILNNSYYLCTESKFEKIYETAYHSNCVIDGSIVQC